MKNSQANRRRPPGRLLIGCLLATSVVSICLAALTPDKVAQLNANALPIDLNRGASGLSRYLLALGTRASLLMVTAHPDDEDGGLLAYQTRCLGARTALLTLTRGEGGQNAMSTDFYDALGLVRTQELLQSDRFYGVDQYWGTVIDYGFSKTREEALEKWGYDRVLSDTVRVVRMTRPLVITSVFAGAPTDGHGNHQVSGQMAQEVFNAAGDPNRFPEQIRAGLRPWKPLKMYARVPFFTPTKDKTIYDYATDHYVPIHFYDYLHKTWIDQTPSTDVRIPEATFHGPSGLTFLQIGREGWGFQKSQNGGGTLPPPSLYSAPYHRYGSLVPVTGTEHSLYDGIDVSLRGVAALSTGGDTAFLDKGLSDIARCVAEAAEQYRLNGDSSIAPQLAHGLKRTRELLTEAQASKLAEPGRSNILFELDRKAEQFEQVMTLALHLSFQANVAPSKEPSGPFGGTSTTFTVAIPGQSFGVRTQLLNGSRDPVEVRSVQVAASDGKNWKISGNTASANPLAGGKELKQNFSVVAPSDATLTKPYFGRASPEQAFYNVQNERFRTLSVAPYPLWATAHLAFEGVDWNVRQVVQTISRIETIGLRQEPLLMAPAISVSVSPEGGAVPLEAHSFTFTCSLRSNVKGPAKGVLRLHLPEGWRSNPGDTPFELTRDGEGENLTFQVSPGRVEPKHYEIRATAEYAGKQYEEGFRMVGYPGLRPYPYYRPAAYEATGVDVKTASGLRIAFFAGTGDDLPQALENLGLHVATLGAKDLESADLRQFDVIIIGVRAYGARPELRAANLRLLQYVKDGGELIVQYNLQNLDDGYGPYPFSLGSNPQKVVDENSAVTILLPGSPALNWPNRLTEADFHGWEEERGHGFMEKWDPRYQSLLETHDPDQPPQRGGLLVARYGKGWYVYNALALYRQLPSGVPGAYRLLANLVSLPRNPTRN